MKWLTRTRIIIIIILLIIGYFVYRTWFAPKATTWQSSTVTRTKLVETLTLSGEINAKERAILDFQTSGRLAWLGVKEGDRVKKYQALASLDTAALKKQLQQSLNNYMANRATFEQTQSDRKDWQLIGEQNEREEIQRIVQKSQFSLNNSVLDVELQDLAIRWSTVTTPIAGIVTQAAPTQAGINVTPANSGFEVVNPDTLYFAVDADQNEVVTIRDHQPVVIALDSFDNQQITGQVSKIGYTPKTGETSTLYAVEVTFPLTDSMKQNIRIGMTGDAEFVTSTADQTLAIDQQFLQADDRGDYVYTDQKGTKQYVKTGIQTTDKIQIVEGLQEGQTIYIQGE